MSWNVPPTRSAREPLAWLALAAFGQLEAGAAHRFLQPGAIAEPSWIDADVSILRIDGDAEIGVSAPQVHRLRSDQDSRRPLLN